MESTTHEHLTAAKALSLEIDGYLATTPPLKVQQLGGDPLSGQRTGDSPGSSDIYLVTFDLDQAFFKPVDGIAVDTADIFDADGNSVAVAEVAAAAVARALGAPYEDMVPATVLREIDGMLGTVCWRVTGEMCVPPNLPNDQLFAGALFDSLIANQDRHLGNYYFDEETGLLGLFDHGYTFATPGCYLNASYLVGERLEGNAGALGADELAALHGADLSALHGVLTDERMEALTDRLDRMLDTETIATGP